MYYMVYTGFHMNSVVRQLLEQSAVAQRVRRYKKAST